MTISPTSHHRGAPGPTPARTPALRRLAGALAVVALAGASLAAQANPHGPGGGMRGPGMHEGMHGGQGMGMGLGLPLMAGPALDRALDAVGATAEQKSQVRQIMQAAMTDLRSQRESGKTLREQMGKLFTQPTVDANAAEQLRAQLGVQREQASRRMLQAMIEVSRVLSPEQRHKLVERAQRARAMMERHRSERESLDRPGR